MVCNESLHYMLFSGIDRISGKNVVPKTSTETLSANQIAGFWNQLYILNTTVQQKPVFSMLMQVPLNLKLT